MRIYQVAITVDYCEDHARITLGMTPNFNSDINMTKMAYGITQENWKDIVIFPQSNVKVVIQAFETDTITNEFVDDSNKDMTAIVMGNNNELGWYVKRDVFKEGVPLSMTLDHLDLSCQ